MAISDILTYNDLTRLRQQYDAQLMGAMMGAVLTTTYPASTPYVDTIGALFYGGPTANMTGAALSAANRERCLIALLATRGAGLNLALHIYLALAAHVSPEEIAQILLLVGTYSGVDISPARFRPSARRSKRFAPCCRRATPRRKRCSRRW